ncbi:MAG: SemiSWEET transporter [Elusimicrobia bacterium]|nr:SemiSWEET transporter [Elusimicrobiota bacterium]
MIEVLGYCAGFLTTVSFVPQAMKILRSKSAHDVSMQTYGILAAGSLLWMMYGIFTSSLPIIIANVITFGFVLFVIFLKLRYAK